MTDTSGRVSGWWQAEERRRHPPQVTARAVVPHQRMRNRREMPHWLPVAAGAVLVWWPVTFVFGLLGSGIWLLFVSMVLGLLSVPALVVLLVHADRRSRAAARRRAPRARTRSPRQF